FIFLAAILLVSTACGTKLSSQPPGNENGDIPGFDKTAFPNEEGKIYGAWQGRVDETGPVVRLFVNRAGYFVMAMKCSGGPWARGAVRATVTQNSVTMLSDLTGEGRNSDGSL